MKIYLLILLLVLQGYSSKSQHVNFSATGTMEHSQFVFDTIISSKIFLQNASVEFSHIDSASIEDSRYKKILQPFLLKGIQDSADYFFIANNTEKEIKFSIPYRLFAIQIAQTNTNEFRPINLFATQLCGTNIYERTISRGEIFIFKKSITKSTDKIFTQSKVKILTKTNGILISRSFYTAIDKNAFTINSGYYSEYEKYKNRIFFLDK